MRLLVIFSVFVVGQALTPSSFLSTVDRSRLKALFDKSTGDETSIAYAILGYKLLGETAPNSADLCKKLQAVVDRADVKPLSLYQSAMAAKALQSCTIKLNAKAGQVLADTLKDDKAEMAALFHAVFAQHSLQGKVVDGNAVLKSLEAILKADDGLANLGMAFNVASVLAVETTAIFDRIEDAVVQADEVDGKILQFDGGLAVSSSVVVGAYELAKKAKRRPPISKEQSVKMANYFLSRKNAQTARAAWHVLSAVHALANNDFHVPVAMAAAEGSSLTVSAGKPTVRFSVTDLMGSPLGPMSVVVDSAVKDGGSTIMAKDKMRPVAGKAGVYEIDVWAAKPQRGAYELTLTATPDKADSRLAGNEAATFNVRVLGEVVVAGVEVGVGDVDLATDPKMARVDHPHKLATALVADANHRLVVRFSLADKAGGAAMAVHQAFVRLARGDDAEVIYVAEQEADGAYKFDLPVAAKAGEFASESGLYSLSLVIGDAAISNPVAWNLADVRLTFPDDGAAAAGGRAPGLRAKPEIRHAFRQPETRPPAAVSNAFTALCLAPFAVMLGLWLKLGANASGFSFSPETFGFHAGLGAIFALYYYFWLQLNMFTTVKYLAMVGVVTFLCGNSMLFKIAQKRKGN